jgi:FixJ family two-component response regulator
MLSKQPPRLLRSAGLQTTAFASGQAFLDSMAGAVPDCVVLDIHMPLLDGFVVQRELARRGLRIPVVRITAHDDPNLRRQAREAGALAFLTKPFNDVDLLNAVHAALAGGEFVR